MDKIIEELTEYAEAEGTEIGELCQFLITIRQYSDYFLNNETKKAIEAEIKSQLQNFKDHSFFSYRTVKQEKIVRELEWD